MCDIKFRSLYVRCLLPSARSSIRLMHYRIIQTPSGPLVQCFGCDFCSGSSVCTNCIEALRQRVESGEEFPFAPYSSDISPADVGR